MQGVSAAVISCGPPSSGKSWLPRTPQPAFRFSAGSACPRFLRSHPAGIWRKTENVSYHGESRAIVIMRGGILIMRSILRSRSRADPVTWRRTNFKSRVLCEHSSMHERHVTLQIFRHFSATGQPARVHVSALPACTVYDVDLGEAGVVLIPGGMLDCLVVPREDTTLHTSNHAGAQRGGYRPFGPAASVTIEGASPRALSISADKILLSGGEPRGTDFAGVTLLPCCLSQLPHAWNTIQLIRTWPGRRNAWCICACPRTDSVLCGVRRRGPT